jgi:hypothetical protein
MPRPHRVRNPLAPHRRNILTAPSLTAFSAAPREHHVAVDADIGTGGEDKPRGDSVQIGNMRA